jgi:hypothetical protein
MIVVIQCAAAKRSGAGRLVSASGKPVCFVANPEVAPADSNYLYARPDDLSDNERSWRQVLLEYNERPANNPLGLYRACELYANPVYAKLAESFREKFYILSAGWGLINAEFLTPYYDITFSSAAEGYKRRRKGDRYKDFSMPPHLLDEEIVFLGGKNYVSLFCSITALARNRRRVFFNSQRPPDAPGCVLKWFATSTRTNWHYACANAVIDGAATTT